MKIIFYECISKPFMESLKVFRFTKKISSWEVSAQKVIKTVQHGTNLVLDGFKDYCSNILECWTTFEKAP